MLPGLKTLWYVARIINIAIYRTWHRKETSVNIWRTALNLLENKNCSTSRRTPVQQTCLFSKPAWPAGYLPRWRHIRRRTPASFSAAHVCKRAEVTYNRRRADMVQAYISGWRGYFWSEGLSAVIGVLEGNVQHLLIEWLRFCLELHISSHRSCANQARVPRRRSVSKTAVCDVEFNNWFLLLYQEACSICTVVRFTPVCVEAAEPTCWAGYSCLRKITFVPIILY